MLLQGDPSSIRRPCPRGDPLHGSAAARELPGFGRGVEVVASVVGARLKVQSLPNGDRGRFDRDPGARQGKIRPLGLEHPVEVVAAHGAGVVQHDPSERLLRSLCQKTRENPSIRLHRGRLVLAGVV